jgi:omega-6 fatty acid desaturase / acyl-lipid omega-6 desaturase (Delta-12 desaturase)
MNSVESSMVTKQTLRQVIPSHCFERNTWISFSYLLLDLFILFSLLYFSSFISYFPISLQAILWFLWCFIQGTFMTSVWVIAHECGHEAFSSSRIINDTG